MKCYNDNEDEMTKHTPHMQHTSWAIIITILLEVKNFRWSYFYPSYSFGHLVRKTKDRGAFLK